MAAAVSAGEVCVELLMIWTPSKIDRGRLESFVDELSMRIIWDGDVSFAASTADRPTAPAPKMAIVEQGGGLAMFPAFISNVSIKRGPSLDLQNRARPSHDSTAQTCK